MGNCGVGFAPVRPARRPRVPDRADGGRRGHPRHRRCTRACAWDWESFPEYLDAVDRRPHAIDIGAQMPHAALRTYVMGERGARPRDRPHARGDRRDEPPHRRGAAGRRAGLHHLAHDQPPLPRPGNRSARSPPPRTSCWGIGEALGARPAAGVFQIVSDFRDLDFELGLMRRHLRGRTGVPCRSAHPERPRRPTSGGRCSTGSSRPRPRAPT